jgi:PAS domain S-box-containing protein
MDASSWRVPADGYRVRFFFASQDRPCGLLPVEDPVPLTPLLFLNALLVGVFAFAAVHYFNVWWLSRSTRIPAVIATYALLNALQMVAVSVLNSSNDVRLSQTALDARTTFGVASGAALVWLIAELTHFKPRKYLWTVTVVPLVIVAINLVVPIAGHVTAINDVVLPWGETTRAVERQGSIPWLVLTAYLSIFSVYAFGVLAGWRLARHDRVSGVLTVAAGALSMGNALYAFLIDLQGMRAPFLGVIFSMVWIMLATVLFSREYAAREEGLAASEARLAVSEARYRTLIESAPEAIVVLDIDQQRIVDVNPEACRMFATTSEALGRIDPLAISPPLQPDGRESTVAAAGYLEAAIAGGVPVFEWIHRTCDGRDFPTEVRLVRLPDPERILIRGSITDISDRHRLEEQLRQSQKMEAIGQLAGGVAHDFNNLLTVISGYAEILLSKLPAGDANATLVKAIGDATERAAWLTARLLAFGRRAVLTPQVFDLNALVSDGERILRRLIGEHIGLRVDAAPQPLYVRLDPGQWSQVMLNLAINARDAMPAGGDLTIRTRSQVADAEFLHTHTGIAAGTYAAFTVTDTGYGMLPDVRSRIFEPFFTTKEVGKGTGLGLAVVHGIVTQAGGCIDVQTAPGEGTTFTVYLPAADAAPEEARSTAAGREHGAGESILLVEDETILREMLEVALTAHGFKVLTASDGEDALRIVESPGASVDLLVTDMVMPGRLNGRDLAEAVRKRLPQVKVLYISGYIDDPALRTAGLGENAPWLQKPFSLAAIARKARETLDNGH